MIKINSDCFNCVSMAILTYITVIEDLKKFHEISVRFIISIVSDYRKLAFNKFETIKGKDKAIFLQIK